MKQMLAKDPRQRISAQGALEHEWIITGGTFMSPSTKTPVYLQLAHENMKRFQEEYFSLFSPLIRLIGTSIALA